MGSKLKRCPRCYSEVRIKLPDDFVEYECGSSGILHRELGEQTDRCRLAELERDPRRNCPEIQEILGRLLVNPKMRRSKNAN